MTSLYNAVSEFLGLPTGFECFSAVAVVFIFMILTAVILSVFSSIFFALFNKID